MIALDPTRPEIYDCEFVNISASAFPSAAYPFSASVLSANVADVYITDSILTHCTIGAVPFIAINLKAVVEFENLFITNSRYINTTNAQGPILVTSKGDLLKSRSIYILSSKIAGVHAFYATQKIVDSTFSNCIGNQGRAMCFSHVPSYQSLYMVFARLSLQSQLRERRRRHKLRTMSSSTTPRCTEAQSPSNRQLQTTTPLYCALDQRPYTARQISGASTAQRNERMQHCHTVRRHNERQWKGHCSGGCA
eukprot:TRINITY_DN7515_c0_g1_i1.p1 TRINITY_DN7515_c0_g1~~TRINITY_DN7515_c0_g1_i1.p1  ORF type:complete len:251 (-),score=3.59 TRINITY_DN7515_c0_g1_i1:537-1289(-)